MAKGYIYDKLYNRKIEGESSFADAGSLSALREEFDNLEPRVDALEDEKDSFTPLVEIDEESAYLSVETIDELLFALVTLPAKNGRYLINVQNIGVQPDILEIRFPVGSISLINANVPNDTPFTDSYGYGNEYTDTTYTDFDVSNLMGPIVVIVTNGVVSFAYSHLEH